MASPTFRLISNDVMLESVGAALTGLATLLFMRACAAPEDVNRWRWFAVILTVPLAAQIRKPPARKAAPAAVAPKKIVPEITCPTLLGAGVKTRLSFCEVIAGRDPAGGAPANRRGGRLEQGGCPELKRVREGEMVGDTGFEPVTPRM